MMLKHQDLQMFYKQIGVIFSLLRFRVALARHNFRWVKIYINELSRIRVNLMMYFCLCCAGNVVNGPIGKQMLDTLVESTANFEVQF